MRQHLCLIALLVRDGAAINFPYESIQLTASDVSSFSAVAFGNASTAVLHNSTCRAFPGTDEWPPDTDWARLNSTVDGQLLHPIPLGAVCYPGTSGMGVYNMTKCIDLLYGAFDSRVFIDDPLTVLTQWPQGETCNATPFASGNCTRGGFPEYVVNVSTVKHIQAAVNFARNKNIRLVIKNTGHDFVGRSAGAGSLSVWTHHLKSFEFLQSYNSTSGYKGMAARVGVGLEAWELYKYMDRYNMTLVVPGGQTVGAFGGWMAGGGHSSLGSMFGMGSDQVLALHVVTADGNFITVDAETNSDLFYALRGGGPGTYGIVTSAIVRAFPAVHVSEASISFQVGSFSTFAFGNNTGNLSFPGGSYSNPFNFSNPLNLTNPFNGTFGNRTWTPPRPVTAPSVDAFWKAVSAYFRFGKELCDGGGTGYSYVSRISPSTNGSDGSYSFSTTLELPGMTPSDAQLFLQPLYTSLSQLGTNVSNTLPRTSLSWGPGPQQGAGASPGDVRFATRLFPRETWESDQRFDAMMDTLRSAIQAGYSFHGVQVAPANNLPAVLSPGNSSVNPAFRKALMHGDIFDNGGFGGDYNSRSNSTSSVTASRARFESMLDKIRAVTPGSGAYINEADPDEPDWQRSFWGSEYPKLLQIKKARDPWGLFWAPKTVGSEGWSVQTEARFAGSQNGRLCRTL